MPVVSVLKNIKQEADKTITLSDLKSSTELNLYSIDTNVIKKQRREFINKEDKLDMTNNLKAVRSDKAKAYAPKEAKTHYYHEDIPSAAGLDATSSRYMNSLNKIYQNVARQTDSHLTSALYQFVVNPDLLNSHLSSSIEMGNFLQLFLYAIKQAISYAPEFMSKTGYLNPYVK